MRRRSHRLSKRSKLFGPALFKPRSVLPGAKPSNAVILARSGATRGVLQLPPKGGGTGRHAKAVRPVTDHTMKAGVAAMKLGIGLVLLIGAMLVAPSANAAEPPIENLSPQSGASLPSSTDLNQGPLHFTCPTATTESSYIPVTWRDYSVRIATSPEVGPDGGLATAFTVAYESAFPINAAETECRNSQAPRVLPPGTYYWQVIRGYADTPSHIATGPIWSFVIQSPQTPTPLPMPSPEPELRPRFFTYIACGLTTNASRASTCARQSKIGAFIQSSVATSYTVCVRSPSHAVSCARNQHAEPGRTYVNAISSRAPGAYLVTWYVGGSKIQKGVRRRD